MTTRSHVRRQVSRPAPKRANGIVVVRTVDEIVDRHRAPWEKARHRGAVLDALRTCNGYRHPLPTWLGTVIDDIVRQWVDEAPTGRKGRQARYATERRDVVEDLKREHFYRNQRDRGLTRDDAIAVTAEFFRVADSTIRDSLSRAKRMSAEKRYLSGPEGVQMLMWTDPKEWKEMLRRWAELEQRYQPSRRSGRRPVVR